MSIRHTLICTAGTSLFEGNLKRLSADAPGAPANWQLLGNAFERQDWKTLVRELLNVNPTARVCGAEINTIEEVRKKNWLNLEKLVFLVSDTEAGKSTGEVLQAYYEQREDLDLRSVEFDVVEELQDKRPKDFRVHGLRNLVRKIGEHIQRSGGIECVAIDATGGYKAQIAIAVVIGQALNIPVYYKHELFAEIIDFPPLPVSLDYSVLGRNADILTDFERGQVLSNEELGQLDEKLRVFLTEVEIDDQMLYELNHIGQIYLTGFRLRFPSEQKPAPAEIRERPEFKGHHYPQGIEDFAVKVWQENEWIVTIKPESYDKQKSIKGTGFFVTPDNKLLGTYKDRKNFGGRMWIQISDDATSALTWSADQLNQKYRKN